MATTTDLTIDTIDLMHRGHPGLIASYLLRSGGTSLLLEPGPAATFPILCEGLTKAGCPLESLDGVLVSHVHLDHSAASGHFAQRGVPIHLHHAGVAHLVDPSKLLSSAARLFGDEMDALWGDVLPVDPSMVRSVADGDTIPLGNLCIHALDTPGHAVHHHCWMLDHGGTRSIFTGDIAAMIVPETDHHLLACPPPEFDLELWMASIDRIQSLAPDHLYLTHFGRIDDPLPFLESVRSHLHDSIDHLMASLDAGLSPEEVTSGYRTWLLEHAQAGGFTAEQITPFLPDHLLAMNIAGISRWRTTLDP
jgi:glyoxylase-like metal-dependent hydrolase (beta-lactamase superfamily II)